MSWRSLEPLTLAVLLALAGGAAAQPPAARVAELTHLVRQDCGSCHGMRLAGGLGPALLPHTLADKPLDSLVATVLDGRPGTAMPPWRRFLDEAEARWVVERLMAGFPEDSQ